MVSVLTAVLIGHQFAQAIFEWIETWYKQSEASPVDPKSSAPSNYGNLKAPTPAT